MLALLISTCLFPHKLAAQQAQQLSDDPTAICQREQEKESAVVRGFVFKTYEDDIEDPACLQVFHDGKVVFREAESAKHYYLGQPAFRTRFPPEPNGYLHIGHAKAICLDFGIAREFAGWCNLRLDDTNPGKEDPEFVEGIKDDVRWLGYEWHDLRHASDYFEVFYRAALKLIRDGTAFVGDLTADSCANIAARSPSRAAIRRIAIVASRKIWICSGACARANSPTAQRPCARRST